MRRNKNWRAHLDLITCVLHKKAPKKVPKKLKDSTAERFASAIEKRGGLEGPADFPVKVLVTTTSTKKPRPWEKTRISSYPVCN